MSRLSRFLHLERPRAAAPGDAEPSPGTAERIEGVQASGPLPAAPRSSGAGLDRFGPEPPPRIELLETAAGVQPFTRCMRCGRDHGVFATACDGCGASLDTAEQHAFNAQLWARLQAEAAQEAAAAAERKELEARARAELDRERRAMGESLAREVAARERLRLGGDAARGIGWGGGGWRSGEDRAPIGLRLLRALPDWRWQLGAAAALLAALGGLVAWGLHGHPGALFVSVLVVILLVVPGWHLDGP